MKRTQFVKGKYYHIYNRGVEKRNVFLNDHDYWRFLQALLLFNDKKSSAHIINELERKKQSPTLINITNAFSESDSEKLVGIVCYCLMPNHFHLLLKEETERGISTFMHKLSTGYTNYFNKKNERVGSLFQGKFKAISIDSDEYLAQLSRYIHTNPMELIEPNWKSEGVKDTIRINEFLKNYKWSSYQDYIGLRNSKIINKEIIDGLFSASEGYKNFIQGLYDEDFDIIKPFILES